MNLRATCPNCESSSYCTGPFPRDWTCPACRQPHALVAPDIADAKPLAACIACGNRQLYRQKNFPQWLGLTILAIACASFFILQGLYEPRLAWIILLGSAAFDGMLYLLVGDVIVCYRCQSRHYGLPRHKSYDPFELAIAEKYRQERLRRDMQAADSNAKL